MGEKAKAGGVSGERLKSIVERIERLEEEKATLTKDISAVYAEAKSTGFDVKVLRRLIALRKMDESDRQEFASLLSVT